MNKMEVRVVAQKNNQILFAYTINLETKEADFTGNVGVIEAVQILQQIAIAEVAKQIQAGKEKNKRKKSKGD